MAVSTSRPGRCHRVRLSCAAADSDGVPEAWATSSQIADVRAPQEHPEIHIGNQAQTIDPHVFSGTDGGYLERGQEQPPPTANETFARCGSSAAGLAWPGLARLTNTPMLTSTSEVAAFRLLIAPTIQGSSIAASTGTVSSTAIGV